MIKPFQFKTTRTRKVAVDRRRVDKEEKNPNSLEPPPGMIQGQAPGSVQEWRVALALNRLKIGYDYQRSVGGGRSVAGGQVVDFWAYTQPMPTPIYVQGAYWHRAAKSLEDTYKQQKLIAQYKGQIMQPLIMKEEELGSLEEAYTNLRRKLMAL